MPIHEFNSDFVLGSIPTDLPNGLKEVPAARQLSHAEGGRKPLDGTEHQAYPYHLEEYLQPGFWSLDSAVKQYFSGVRVPTKDSYRFMRTKIAGGDKSLLIWADDIKEGRARLPLAAISRESHEFHPEKFSPAYHPMTARYLNTRGNLVAKVFRPTPFLVEYKLTIWAERKRDAEYILYQLLPRFRPLAEFRMSDGKIAGNVQLRYGGCSDASDKESGYDQHANVRYEMSTTAEAWLPLPEQVVPTVLGRTTILKEKMGEILAVNTGSVGVLPPTVEGSGNQWYRPIQM